MAVRIRKLVSFIPCRTLSIPNIYNSNSFTTYSKEDGMKHDHEFQKWCSGGGLFHQSACIDPSALIEVGAVVHSRAVIGSNVYIGSGTIVGPSVAVGESTRIGIQFSSQTCTFPLNPRYCGLLPLSWERYNVALSNCTIGDCCVIHHGVCMGQDGFGFMVDEQGKIVKKPQLLKTMVGNHVEIGANTCIDRGSWRDTAIGDHTKIDNLVQIGHNVVIGKSCMICGQAGISGSVTLGDYVTLGGRVGIRDHVCIGSKVRLAANSCVTKDINEPGDYGGFPAIPIRQWRRQVAIHRRTSK